MRPERFAHGGANSFTGEVMEAVYLGSSFKLRLACDDGLELIVRQPARGTCRRPASASRSASSRTRSMCSRLHSPSPAEVLIRERARAS